jgi:glycosyltransferase involved in cell wall biosynthesis
VLVRRVAAEHDDRRLARWYQAADVYVHPARADTFPLMVLEALACGTPVIGTAVGGVPEQISSAGFIAGSVGDSVRDGATGAVVPAGDAAALAAAIESFFASDEGVRAALSSDAARTAREKFDRRRHAREYLDWIHALVAERSGSPREHPR